MQILYFVFSWILKQEEKRTRVVNIDSVVSFCFARARGGLFWRKEL